MPQCTARVTGVHRTASGAARCPVHGTGRSGYRPRSSGRTSLPPLTRAGTGPVAPPPQRTTVPSRSGRAVQVQRVLTQAGLDAAQGGQFVSILLDVSADLSNEATRRSRPTHWLCQILADAADAIDPASVAGTIGEVFADEMVRTGIPQWVADIAGWGFARAAENALSTVSPGAQLCLGLRVLGALVCPDPSSCPAEDQISVPIVQELLAQSPGS